MSTSQAKLLTEVIDAGRMLLEVPLKQLITLHLRLQGRRGKFTLKWPEVSLIDLVDTARARWMDAQAEQIEIENMQSLVRMGIYSMPEAAAKLRPDLEGLKPDEVLERLNGEDGAPKLLEELPEPAMPAPGASGAARGQAGQMTRPSMTRDDVPGASNPRDESTRAMVRYELKEIFADESDRRAALNGKH